MTTFKVRNANTAKEKDLPEIVVMIGFVAAVLGAVVGYMLIKIVGAIAGAVLGCVLGSFLAHRLVTRGINNGAKEIKLRHQPPASGPQA